MNQAILDHILQGPSSYVAARSIYRSRTIDINTNYCIDYRSSMSSTSAPSSSSTNEVNLIMSPKLLNDQARQVYKRNYMIANGCVKLGKRMARMMLS